MLKDKLGMAPQPTDGEGYKPSPLALKLATQEKTNYEKQDFEQPYTGGKLKVMVVCTEQNLLTMANGKQFSTGNHPVELFVPMLHLRNAGFDFDFFTPNGGPVQLEMWAMPEEDLQVMKLYEEQKLALAQPKSLAEFVPEQMSSSSEYAAVFFPGGHGALLGLPNDENVGKLLHWAQQRELKTLLICHGPAALLSAERPGEDFLYSGYSIVAFPDSADKLTPAIGYMPGQVPWQFGKELKKRGVKVTNLLADKSCKVDRNLISGASPLAANDFGKLAAEELLKKVNAK